MSIGILQASFNLTAQDLATLSKSFITSELAERACLRRVDSPTGAALVGRNGSSDYSGIVFTYFWPGEEFPREYRLRRDNPEMERRPDGTLKEKAKYLSPKGGSNLLYFFRDTKAEWLQDVSLPIAFTEGEKKVIALWQLSNHALTDVRPRFLPIGLAGVWNWRGVIGKTENADGKRVDVKGTISDLEHINFSGREVLIIFDTNATTNQMVTNARDTFAHELMRRGARARIVDLPQVDGVNGVDDLLYVKGVDFVLTLIKNAKLYEDACSWQEPEPLPDQMWPVPAMQKELLPTQFADWLVDIAERIQCPLDYLAVAVMVGIASIVGNQIGIRPKQHDDWLVVPNLFGAIIGRPGVLKSPALDEALQPIKKLIVEAKQRYSGDLAEWEIEKIEAEAKKQKLKKKITQVTKEEGTLDRAALRAELEEISNRVEPKERRYIVNDVTVEKLGELLNENPRGLLMFRDELVGWLRTLDREGHEGDRPFYLEAWNGTGSFNYDRISRGSLHIKNVTLSVLGGIQPSLLSVYLHQALSGTKGDDGLLQRFQLMVFPNISKEWQNIDRPPNTEKKDGAVKVFKALDELDITEFGAITDEDVSIPYLHFDDKAQEFFTEWRTKLELTLRSGELEHAAIEAHIAKYRSLMPTLALLFHLIDKASGSTQQSSVSLDSTMKAAAWCEYLFEHAKRIYGLGLNAATRLARSLADRIKAGDLPDTFTAREVYRKHWAGLTSPQEVSEVLGMLEDYGWLRSVKLKGQSEGGRSSITYIVNPKVRQIS